MTALFCAKSTLTSSVRRVVVAVLGMGSAPFGAWVVPWEEARSVLRDTWRSPVGALDADDREACEQLLGVPVALLCPPDHLDVRRASIGEGGDVAALRQTLNVPCRPTGASPMPRRSWRPFARSRSATTGGTLRANARSSEVRIRARVRLATGPAYRLAIGCARIPEGLLLGPITLAGQRLQVDPESLLGSRVEATDQRRSLELLGRGDRGPAGEGRPVPYVGIAHTERVARPGAEQLAERETGLTLERSSFAGHGEQRPKAPAGVGRPRRAG